MIFALQQAPAAPGGVNPMIANLLLIGGMVALFYFLIIRPQSKARKQMEERLSKLKAGDEVLLSSGLF
ncbi:MAG TPA: preprotein translocase subunit YajC, partial [Holophaga sp.]|nr:preprotein translocase subunit YajC [Holophaga sp.]